MPGDTEGTEEDRRGTEFGKTGEAGSHSSEANRPNLLDQNHEGTRVRSGVTAGVREIRGQRLSEALMNADAVAASASEWRGSGR